MPSVDIFWIFLGMSVFFGTLSVRDYLRHGQQLEPAGRSWRNIAVIFSLVTVMLLTTGA